MTGSSVLCSGLHQRRRCRLVTVMRRHGVRSYCLLLRARGRRQLMRVKNVWRIHGGEAVLDTRRAVGTRSIEVLGRSKTRRWRRGTVRGGGCRSELGRRVSRVPGVDRRGAETRRKAVCGELTMQTEIREAHARGGKLVCRCKKRGWVKAQRRELWQWEGRCGRGEVWWVGDRKLDAEINWKEGPNDCRARGKQQL